MTKIFANIWVHFFFLLLILLGMVWFNGSDFELRKRLQYATFDTYNKILPREKSDAVTIVDIDEASLKHMGQWPWPRPVVGEMVKNLKELGAKTVAFDMVFAEPDRTSPSKISQYLPKDASYDGVKSVLSTMPDNDAVFAQYIQDAGNVVTGFTAARAEETLRLPVMRSPVNFLTVPKDVFVTDKNSFKPSGIAANLTIIAEAAAGNGSFMATPDIDGVIRQVPLFVVYPYVSGEPAKSEVYQSLSLEAVRVSLSSDARLIVKKNGAAKREDNKGFADDIQKYFASDFIISGGGINVPIESDGRFWVYFRDIQRDEYVSAYKLYDEAERKKLRDKINGKIVFVGSSAEGLKDLRSSPLNPSIAGVEVHANAVEQILQNKFLTRNERFIDFEGKVIAIAGLLILLLAAFMNVIVLGALTIILMGGMFFMSWEGYVQAGLLIDPVYPSIALSVLFLASSLLSYIRSESERRQVRQAFGLYISPTFMEELTKDPDKLKLGGEVKDLTVMFTDIRSFTTISERLTPEELIQLMNDFLTPMSDLVMSNRGTIDKYMGDAMMAFWNAPLDDADHARHACLAALKMNEALVPINERVKERAAKEGYTPVLLNAGIGVNTGPCSVGNMGSRQRFAYSALGDAVNLASRLEGQTKTYGVNILVGEDTVRLAPGMAMLEMDLIRVKGKEKPVRIFTLLGDEAMAATDVYKTWQTAHNGFLAAYRVADFGCAAQEMKTARDASGGRLSAYYDLFAGRIAEFTKNPPPEDWDGVFVATEK